MDLPTQPISATSQGKETLLQNQRACVFNIPSTAQGTEATRLLWGGTIINGLATSKGIKQFSKPKISFMG